MKVLLIAPNVDGTDVGEALMAFKWAEALATEAAGDEVCAAANDNDPSQVVVSGHRAAVERAVDLAKEKGAKRAMLLPVSAPGGEARALTSMTNGASNPAWSPDGQRILAAKSLESTPTRRDPVVVINWIEELEAKIPAAK